MEKQNFWSDCLSLIKQQITNQAYETWFSDVEILELTEEEMNNEIDPDEKLKERWHQYNRYTSFYDEFTALNKVEEIVATATSS